MKLHLAHSTDKQLITGYGDTWIEVNQARFSASLIVLPDRVIKDWEVLQFESLTQTHFEKIALLEPEVVLLGTGKTQRFIHPALGRTLTESGVGIECMTTAAACRTYNFLMAEGRHVAAVLII